MILFKHYYYVLHKISSIPQLILKVFLGVEKKNKTKQTSSTYLHFLIFPRAVGGVADKNLTTQTFVLRTKIIQNSIKLHNSFVK